MTSDISLADTFTYFAFGSNLLTERIMLNNPSAQKIAIGKVEGYRLDFNHYSNRWKGAIATIVEDKKHHVYGVLWRLKMEDLKNLDRQEGVHNNLYHPIELVVETQAGEKIKARSYQLVNFTPAKDAKPSYIYLSVIIHGAKEHGLPQEYIDLLERICHNGYKGVVGVDLPQLKSVILP